jgi:hypothetical protein
MNLSEKLRLAEQGRISQNISFANTTPGKSGSSCCGKRSGDIEILTIESKVYKLRISELCPFAKQTSFHNWLSGAAPDIRDELLEHLGINKNCPANINRIYMALGQLRERNRLGELLEFMEKEFPLVIQPNESPQ